ncbi:MAG: fused MFS/spermidine synthase [Sedimentisphaerales bacterium]|nr:fused MFS/spermidine synthase [Sedimentisphaerales bacterium]
MSFFHTSRPSPYGKSLISFKAAGLVVLCAFFVSGAAGLIHEVAWTRLLRLVMGNTAFSITTVLCAFMGGLALGSFLGGRFIDRRKDPLRMFAYLEGTIAVYCFLLPWLIQGAEPIYRWLYQNTHTSFYLFSLIRFVFAGTVLLVPATFMGATLPVLSRFFVRSLDRVGYPVGMLYSINTFGAVLGGAAAGFFLIPALGVALTIRTACLFNGLVAVTAYLLFRRLGDDVQGHAPVREEIREKAEKGEAVKKKKEAAAPVVATPAAAGRIVYGPREGMFLLIGYGVSGFAALVYEIAWTRALALLIGSSVYAFSMILTAFVLGIALGSMVYARFVDQIRDPMRALAVIQAAIGLTALPVVPLIGNLPFWVTGLISRFGSSFWQLQAVEFAMIVVIVLLPTTLMGAAFPLASRLFVRQSATVGKSVGTLYASNTVGNILGAFAGGFILIPVVGIENTLFVAVMINVLVGGLFFSLSRSLSMMYRGLVAGAVTAVAVVGIILIPPWNAGEMSFGPFYEALRHSKSIARSPAELRTFESQRKVLFHKEDVGATVTVKQLSDGSLTLYTNGKPDASSRGDMPSQQLVAQIPLLLHPDPKSALVVGLASGISLGSAGRHPLERMDCVEIAPGMVAASRYFDDYNYRILDDPRVDLIIGDGRNHLALTDRKYDVIISEPSNPFIAGVADLFTREYFRLCRDRLTDRGVAAAWMQAYLIDKASFSSIVRTFQSVFPEMTLWKTAKGDCIMVGSKGPLKVDYHKLQTRIRQKDVADDLARIGIRNMEDFLAHLVMGKSAVEKFAAGAKIHTDDNALVEFAAPRGLMMGIYQWPLLEAIEEHREADLSFLIAPESEAKALAETKAQTARLIEARGSAYRFYFFKNRGETVGMIEQLKKAAVLNPKDELFREAFDALRKEAFGLAEAGQIERAIVLYRQMIDILPRDAKSHYNLAMMLKRRGDPDGAMGHYREAARLDPGYALALFQMAEIHAEKGSAREAESGYRRTLQVKSDFIPAINNLARLLALYPDPRVRNVPEAVRLAEKGCRMTNYRDPLLLDTLAAAYAASGRYSEALSVAAQGLDIATAQGNNPLADRIRGRMKMYQNRGDGSSGTRK